MSAFLEALQIVSAHEVLIAVALSAVYGLVVGSVPGLPATMAVALLVPFTFYLSPVAALATIVTASAMAIFAGDIPGCLLRIPGTPASAAYTDDAYALTRQGKPELALGASLWFSALGGIFGTIALMFLAPTLASLALQFSSFEYFWLTLLGLMCVALVASGSPLKSVASVCLGLLVACVGINNTAGVPRFTFGSTNLLGGVEVVPALVGMFAVSEVMRAMISAAPARPPRQRYRSILAGQWALTRQYGKQAARGSMVGVLIGILPGAGADMAAWVSYAISKRFSRTPQRFGHGHPEGLVEAGAANNSALSGAWVPALVFGIPGDTITAIAIGVLFMKGLNPGPSLFTDNAASVYALYLIFILSNLIMIPLGIALIRAYSRVVRLSQAAIMPPVLLFCAVGAYSIGNNPFDVLLVAAFGVAGFLMERNGYSIAAFVLGLVMGVMVEQHFLTSMIKSGGSVLPFFERPVAAVLAAMTLTALAVPLVRLAHRRLRGRPAP